MNEGKETFATIITGASRGLGAVITRRMAQDGPVLLVARSADELHGICQEINDNGGTATYVPGDVKDPATADFVAKLLKEKKWSAKNLICNAGIGKTSATHELSPEQWLETFGVNVDGAFYFTKALVPQMIERKSGAICYVSSVAGVHGIAFDAAYAASKHAMIGLAKSVALEYGKHGIISVPICPSYIEGDMTARTISAYAERHEVSQQEARKVIEKQNPQRRIIQPEEVAETVAFICSGKAPSLSGHPIIMSGGA